MPEILLDNKGELELRGGEKTDVFLVSETSQFYEDAGGDFSPESCGLIWVTNSNSIIFLWYLPNKKHELFVASVDFPKKNTKSSHQDQR